MGRPSKSVDVILSEGRNHITEAEIKHRKEAEKNAVSGEGMKERPETKANKAAHREFVRIIKLLRSVGKDDALFEGAVNRYCALRAEEAQLMQERKAVESEIEEIKESYSAKEIEPVDYYNLVSKMRTMLAKIDSGVHAKRNDMLALEKENGFTVNSAIRNIPKRPEKKQNPLLEALRGDDG